MLPSTPLYSLKRKARLLSRAQNIKLSIALDRIAQEEGSRSWSLMAATVCGEPPARKIYPRLERGELLLAAARPGQGKTLFSLQLAVEATRAGHRAYFFSLEYTPRDVVERLHALGVERATLGDSFVFDDSDDISAAYVINRLKMVLPGTLVVIDYLQLLDQRRDKPDLMSQVTTLKSFARQQELIMVFISQVDRAFDLSPKSLPDLDDVRMPNPLDLSLFDKACFLNQGQMTLVG